MDSRSNLRGRMASWLDRASSTLAFRLVVAVLLAGLHLAAFAAAADSRLHQPFRATAEAPYYSDPDAPAVRGYPRQPHHWSRLVLSRWDAQHYIGFAIRGITACPTDGASGPDRDNAYLDCGLGWLPAWGLAGGAVADTTGLAPDVSLILLSILAALAINLLWTSAAIVDRLGRREAWGALLAFNLFPSAFYVVTPYSEAATVALVLAGLVCLVRERWVLGGLAVGAATALRVTAGAFAIGLAAAALHATWRRRRDGASSWWRPLVAIPLSGWGALAQVILLQLSVGDGMAYLRARKAFGDDPHFARLIDPEFYVAGFTSQHMDSVMLVGGALLLLGAGRELLARFRRPEVLYLVIGSALATMMAIASVKAYWGLNRYLLLCPVVFLATGLLARRSLRLFVAWLVVCAAIYWHVELCSYVSQGHPGLCPCLGRVEFVMPFGS